MFTIYNSENDWKFPTSRYNSFYTSSQKSIINVKQLKFLILEEENIQPADITSSISPKWFEIAIYLLGPFIWPVFRATG